MIVILYNADVCSDGTTGVSLVAHKSVMKCVAAVRGALDDLVARGVFVGPVEPLAVGPDLDELRSVLARLRPDWVFHSCEGVAGDSRGEGWVAALLDQMGIAHTGGSPRSLGICLDKFRAKRALQAAGISTPAGYLAESATRNGHAVVFPAIVKPSHEDGSLGISDNSVVYDGAALDRRVRYILRRFKQPAVVEEYVHGDEYSVPVWAGGETLPITQIGYVGFPEGAPRICSYRAKWAVKSWQFRGTPSSCPAAISDDLAMRLRLTATRAYHAVGCDGYARVDFRVGADGEPKVIEVNPNPDISPGAGFVRAAAAAGYDYSAMIRRISEYALARAAEMRVVRRAPVVAAARRGVRRKQAWDEAAKAFASGST